MSKVIVSPSTLRGTVTVPCSKSAAHRAILCAALAAGDSILSPIAISNDIRVTAEAAQALGATIREEQHTWHVTGGHPPKKQAQIDCGESGSTLRFLIPVCAALGIETAFIGRGRLPERPIGVYLDLLPAHGVTCRTKGGLPLSIYGTLNSGEFILPGNISSQFITGLLLACPLLPEESTVRLSSPLESAAYVDMTLDNIANGEPMAVYNGSDEVPMFLGITLNNVMVSFNCFAMGLLTSFGTGYMLLRNGIMIGAFQTFFYQHDLLWESSLAIWLHGTLEIWAIIVAGAAGLALGNGWLFPGTYSRLESFRRSAKKGVKIVIGTVPVFVMAGFIEGFVTRHTELPDLLRLGFILLSLSFIIFYYIYLPNRKKHGITET